MGSCSSNSNIYRKPVTPFKEPSDFDFVLNLQFQCDIDNSKLNELTKEVMLNGKLKNIDRINLLNNSELYISCLNRQIRKTNFEINNNNSNNNTIKLRYFFNFPLTNDEYQELPELIEIEGFFYYEYTFIFNNKFTIKIDKNKLDNDKIDNSENQSISFLPRKGENYFYVNQQENIV